MVAFNLESIIAPALILGLLPAFIAWKFKGRSFFKWWVHGTLLFLIALAHSCVISRSDKKLISSGEYKQCPFCKEVIKIDAVICKHCGKDTE